MGKARLLVVEDDNDISNMLKIYFNGLGYDVDVAPRGSEALEKTRLVLPHLIVLDIMLPDIDGYEVCRRLRQSCLLYTSDAADEEDSVDLGGRRIIKKKFFSSRRRHTRCSVVSWARRCV